MWDIRIETKMYRPNGIMEYTNRTLLGNIQTRNLAMEDLKALYNAEDVPGMMDRKGFRKEEYFVHKEFGNQNYYNAEEKRVYLKFHRA